MAHRRRPDRSFSTGQSLSSWYLILLLSSALVAVVVHGAWWLPSTSFSSSPSPKSDGASHGGGDGHVWFPAWPNLMIIKSAHYWKNIVAGRGVAWLGSSSSSSTVGGDAAASGKNKTACFERDNKTTQPPTRPVTYSRCRPFRLSHLSWSAKTTTTNDADHDAEEDDANDDVDDDDSNYWSKCRPCHHDHAAVDDDEETFRDDDDKHDPPSSPRHHHQQHTFFYITTESMLDPTLILAAGTHVFVWHFFFDSFVWILCLQEGKRASMIKQCASRWNPRKADCRFSFLPLLLTFIFFLEQHLSIRMQAYSGRARSSRSRLTIRRYSNGNNDQHKDDARLVLGPWFRRTTMVNKLMMRLMMN
jgi:hypothetical protein